MGDEGAEDISAILSTNVNTVSLKMDNAGIGDKGVAAIAEALRTNDTLRALTLTNNKYVLEYI